MTIKEVVKSLILSPCYLKIKLKDRERLVRKLAKGPGAPSANEDDGILEGARL